MEKKNELFSNKDFWHLIWPLLIEQLLQISLGLADIFMVASLGENAVSGVSLVDQINVLITYIFVALASGGAVVCSQYIGLGSKKDSQATAKQLLLSITFISFVLMIFGVLTYKWQLRIIFGKIDDAVMDAAQRYYLISLYSIPGIAVYNAAASLFRANKNSSISMKIAILINILNIGGNALLIYGFHWDVDGVAFPTFISRTAAAVVLMICLYRTNSGRRKLDDIRSEYDGSTSSEGSPVSSEDENICITGLLRTRPDWNLIRKIFRIGIPNMLESSSFQLGKILVLNFVTWYGTSAIAANAAGNTLAGVEVIPGNAIQIALLTVVGQCIGAGRNDLAVRYTRKLMWWNQLGFFLLNVPFILCSRFILQLMNLEPQTIQAAWIIVVSHGSLAILFWGLAFCLPNTFKAAGDVGFPLVISALSMWIIRVGLAYIFARTRFFGLMDYFNLPDSFGVLNVWIAMYIDWLVRIVFLVFHYKRMKWLDKKVI